MNRTVKLLLVATLPAAFALPASAENPVTPGAFTVDPPTLSCLGFHWAIEGDANRNATAEVEYRETGSKNWKIAQPLLRIGGFHVGRSSDWLDHKVPHGFAGSILDLKENTEYEARITVKDPDGVGGTPVQTVSVRTRAQPKAAEGGNVYHVFPPGTPANWTKNQFSNLYKAYYGGMGNAGDFNLVWERIAQPGDTILVHAGVYKANLNHYTDPMCVVPDGAYWLTAKGTKEKPIVIKAAGDGEVVFDGAGAEVLFNMMAADWHIVEGITFRNCGYAIFAGQQRVGGCVGLAVRNCRFENVRDGIHTLWNGAKDFYIADNVFLGRNARDGLTGWGEAADGFLKSNTAITLQGAGHVVRRNAIAYFWQGYHMGTAFQGFASGGVACDFYENDLFMLVDDGIEVDGCVRNVRVLRNRFTSTGSPLSAQPVYGGPAYFIRNVAYLHRNGCKFHEAWPSGLLTYHNTMVGGGGVTHGSYSNARFLNNIFMPNEGSSVVMALPSPGNEAYADHNGYGPQTRFVISRVDTAAPIMDKTRDPYYPLKKYPGKNEETAYDSIDAFRVATGHETHGIVLGFAAFESMAPPPRPEWKTPTRSQSPAALNFQLAAGGAAVDRGLPLANVNDGFSGPAPDLGAQEAGAPVPHYGPSWAKGDFDFANAGERPPEPAAPAEAPAADLPAFTIKDGRLAVEAEACHLTQYDVEKAAGYSGDRMVMLANRGQAPRGEIAFLMKAPPGRYTARITFCDEHDGDSSYALSVDGKTVAEWRADAKDGGPGKEPESKKTKIVSGVELGESSTVRLSVKRDKREYGRVDAMEWEAEK